VGSDGKEMNKHDICNKMSAVAARLRRADTLCANAGVIDEIRAALYIVLDVGEACGKTLTKKEK
jgi:hypothetical protein